MSGRSRRTAPSSKQRLAAIDGELVKVDACCRLHIVIGVTRLEVRHDATCPAINPEHLMFTTRRRQANAATAAVLAERGLGPVVVVSP